MRAFFRASATIAAVLFLVLTPACSLRSLAVDAETSHSSATCDHALQHSSKSVTVVNLGWHTGIIIQDAQLTPQLRTLLSSERNQGTDVVAHEFGWGDRDFYTGSGYSIWGGISASFFSQGGVLHVSSFTANDLRFHLEHTEAIDLELSDAGFTYLVERIADTFVLNDKQQSHFLRPGLYGRSAFYEAETGFSIVHTCNSWTSAVLRSAGCGVPGSTRASRLMKQLRLLGRRPTAQIRDPNADATAQVPASF